jgi:hypothetical protein
MRRNKRDKEADNEEDKVKRNNSVKVYFEA